MPYMEGNAGLGDVASNRAAYANIKGGGNPFMTATPERHQRAAVSSGPQGAIIQQDTATQARRVVTSSTRPTTALERRSAAALKALVAEDHSWSGPKPTGLNTFVSGGLGPPLEQAPPSSEVFTRDGVRRIPNGARRVSMKAPENALVYRRSNTSLLGEYGDLAEGPEYLGFSLGKIVKNIGNTVKKAVVDTGHTVGKVVTSTAGQAVLGTALAVTGVGAPAAAAIFATTKGAGNLIKPGGNLKHAVTGAAQGAVEGVVAAGAGKVARAAISKITSSHASTGAAATEAAKAALPSKTDSTMAAILAAGVPAGISMIPGAPQNDGLIPKVSQPAPLFPKQKRVAASDATRGGGSKVGAAKKVLDAGKAVNKKANQGASQIDALSAKLDSLGQAMQAAKEIGDKAGIDALSQAAAAVQAQLQNAQNIAGGASGDLRALGGAAEGAATGAVGGAGLSTLSDFVDAHKPLVYGGAAALALVITAAMMHKPQSGGGTRTVYRSRPRASRR